MTETPMMRDTSTETEVRAITDFEARQGSDGNWTVGGYASTFNDPYKVVDRFGTFTEQILSSAWDRSLQNRGHKIQLLSGHGGLPYGSTKANNLRLATDERGLNFEWSPNPRRTSAVDIAEGIADGTVDEMSVGMRIPEGGDTWAGDQRSISEATLMEISVVARGANPNTEVGMRSDEIVAEIRRLETLLGPFTHPEPETSDDEQRRIRQVQRLARLYDLR